jgi:hypothetical protein
MGSNGPTPLTTNGMVKTPSEAIAFIQHFRTGCRNRHIEWWIDEVLGVFTSEEARAAAAAHLAKATRIDDLMEQNLTTMLQQAPVQGVRLNMDDADNETPAPAAEGTARPTATPATPATNFRSALLPVGTHSLKAIETWALNAATVAMGDAGSLLDEASKNDRPGKESIRTIQRIYAPLTAQAASAARTALDKIFRDFTAEDAASTLVTKGLGAARICLYYKPLVDWSTHVVEEVVHKINELYGPQHLLTLSVARCVDAEGFSTNPMRVELFQSTLITYENTYGCGTSGSSGNRASPLYVRAVAVARDQGRGFGRGNGPPGGRGGGRGGDGNGPGRGGARPGDRFCTWCSTYLGKIYDHDVADCRNKSKPQLLADLRAKGKLQDGGPQAPAAQGHAVCMVCLDSSHKTDACGYLNGVQGLIQRHRAQFATAATNTAAPDGGALNTLLLSDPPLAARLLRDPFGHDGADTFVSVQPKSHRRGSKKDGMKRVRDLAADDVRTPTTDGSFHVPLAKRYKEDASSRRHEMRMCMHAHILRALEVFSVIATTAALRTNTPASAAAEEHLTDSNAADGSKDGRDDSDEEKTFDDSDEEKTFVLGLLGLDTGSDEEYDLTVNKLSNQYSASPSSFAQLDSGATKSISSCPDLFSYILLTPDTRIRVADGHELSGVIGEGPLGTNTGPGLAGTNAIYASNIEGTLLSQVQLVQENNFSFVHTPDECFMQQYTSGQCPICHPHPARRHLLVKESKIFVPLLDTVPEHAAQKFGKFSSISTVGSGTSTNGRLLSNKAHQRCSLPLARELFPDKLVTTSIHTPSEEVPAADTVPPTRELFLPAGDNSVTIAAQTPGAGEAPAANTARGSQTDSARKQLDLQTKILWHSRMPTAGCQALSALAKAFPKIFRFSPDTILPPCHACARARIRKAPAPPASTRIVQPLEEVHFDLFFVCGEIVLIFVDRASRHEWIYFLDKKSDLPKMLQQFLIDANSTHFTVGALTCAISSAMEKGIDAEALNLYLSSHHLAQRVKVFYSDNAREHLSHALDTFLFDMMIDQRFSVVESQHQNGLSENVGWNLLGPVRHDMDISNLSKGFRRAALRLNVERRVCTPRAQLNWKSPFQLLHPTRDPPFKYFKAFGAHCTVLKTSAELQRQGKLEARGEPGIYIGTGYHTKQSGYLVWLPRLHKTVIAEHVLFDETWFPARLDKQVPNICSALPGNITSKNYHSELSATELLSTLPPLHPESILLPQSPGSVPQYHGSVPQSPESVPQSPGSVPQSPGSVPQTASSPLLSPLPTSTHDDAPLTPLGQSLFENLQLHGHILGHHDTNGPPRHLLAPAIPAADVSDQEAHILLNEVPPEDVLLFDDVFDDDIHVRFTQHLLASENLFWKGYCKSPRPPAPPPFKPPPSLSITVTSTTKRFALDLRSGEVIDAKGYVCAGQNVGDIASREHLITRALIKGLKTHAKALTNRHTVNAIALIAQP